MGALRDFVEKHRELVSYVFWGAFTTLISWGTYAIFVQWMGIDSSVSNILSWICGVVFAFITNKIYVFRSRSWNPRTVGREAGLFLSSRIGTGVLSWVVFPVLTAVGLSQSMFGIENMWARVITSLIEIALNWVLSKYLVFRRGAGRDPKEGSEGQQAPRFKAR